MRCKFYTVKSTFLIKKIAIVKLTQTTRANTPKTSKVAFIFSRVLITNQNWMETCIKNHEQKSYIISAHLVLHDYDPI